MRHCREAVEGFVERLIEGVNADLWQELRDLEIVFESEDEPDAGIYESLARRNREDRYEEYLRVAAMCD
ncbi:MULTISPECIES: hypothetical protein [Kyrpidia]|uniref:Uncharacterized protein n=1 Tax=Kyrpidia spormannii TaxID=2055160 RepID=A0A6F9EAW4_9BACL|nr:MULTISPECIES: hypothetical protein [Kyrpidia]MCL6577044.1 hypothetical protein [Kyrpidia sp.]CAB3394030.1 conserved protein of unknown function [Kyrpidia spormannii]